MRVAVRMRHADAGVVSEMARSLHREREHAGESVRTREIACATEAGRCMRPPRMLTTRSRRAAVIA